MKLKKTLGKTFRFQNFFCGSDTDTEIGLWFCLPKPGFGHTLQDIWDICLNVVLLT